MRIILGALLGVYFTMAFYGDINPIAQFNTAADYVTIAIEKGVEVGGQW